MVWIEKESDCNNENDGEKNSILTIYVIATNWVVYFSPSFVAYWRKTNIVGCEFCLLLIVMISECCLLFNRISIHSSSKKKKLGCLFWFSVNWIEIGLDFFSFFFFANLFRDEDREEAR